ncbi:hypothetical protein PJP10_24335 [Mycobacterium kansasii]
MPLACRGRWGVHRGAARRQRTRIERPASRWVVDRGCVRARAWALHRNLQLADG